MKGNGGAPGNVKRHAMTIHQYNNQPWPANGITGPYQCPLGPVLDPTWTDRSLRLDGKVSETTMLPILFQRGGPLA